MEGDPRIQLTDASCDFEEAILNGIDLRVYPPCAIESYLRQCLYQDIGGRMEKERYIQKLWMSKRKERIL